MIALNLAFVLSLLVEYMRINGYIETTGIIENIIIDAVIW